MILSRACLILLAVLLTAALPAKAATMQLWGQTKALFAKQDLLAVKVAVDAMVDPSSRPDLVTAEVDRMAAEIRSMAGDDPKHAELLAALKRYLYDGGVWNGNNPFQYDLADPLGHKPANRLLQHYLTTRRGNCVTMPILFAALGQRLGLTMTLAEAPLHVLVKYTDDEGVIWNLEATSGGGFTRDLWYRQKLPMSDRAVANGVYLRPLSQEESTALIASFLVEHQLGTGAYEDAVATADILLGHYPDFTYVLVKKGSAYSALLRRELTGKYTRMEDIPPDLKIKADGWYAANMQAFAKAEALGWRPQDGQAE